MAKNDIESQIREFRLALLREMPFYGELLSHFEIRESRLISTASTDGREILYNRKFFQELSPEECNYVLMHELMHIKMYPLDQVTESLIQSNFEEGTPGYEFAYRQFFTTLEQTVEELTKCFLLEYGEDKSFSYGRCDKTKSFNELYDGLNSII